jgi:glycosyltransferase involved in cell wall biosynthesis
MVQQISRTIYSWEPDLVIASQDSTACYRNVFKNIPALFEEVEVGLFYDRYNNAKTLYDRVRNGLTWIKHRRYLVNLLHNFQACTVVSDIEKQLLLKICPHNSMTEIIPNCINLSEYESIEKSPRLDSLIFTGSFSYNPNYEAMVWFLEKVFPLIQINYTLLKLVITGNHQDRFLQPVSNVTLTGYVEDVRPLIARSSVSVVPILTGGGTRLKILEAMALHTPVVTTSKGAEGLDVKHGLNILIADTPDEFAGNIIKLINDPILGQRLANSAFQLVKEKYDWQVVIPRFINLVESTINTDRA